MPSFEPVSPRTWVYMLHPRPVVVVVAGTWEDYTAMAASWVMPVSRDPPMLAVAVAPTRYTFEKVLETREFNICVLSSEHLEKIHYLGTVSGREVKDKIAAAGLEKERARRTKAPIVAESLAVAECELYALLPAGDHYVVVGRVVEAYKRAGVELGDPRSYRIPLHVGGDRYTTPEPRTVEAG